MLTLRGVLFALAGAAALCAMAIALTGGTDLYLASHHLSLHSWNRPLGLAVGLALGAQGLAVFAPAVAARGVALTAARIAGLVSVITFATAFATTSNVASGADQFGYVSQADLWLNGQLETPAPALDMPAHSPAGAMAPLGYRRSTDGRAIVPTYSPGLPLMLAAAKALGGACAQRLVEPLAGALLVWFTFLCGRAAASDRVGAGAACLVAASPTVIYMMQTPMSDVPVAAAWTVGLYAALRGGVRQSIVLGVAAAAAIVIRPNLVLLSIPVVAAWPFGRARAPRWHTRAAGVLIAAIFIGAACLFIGWLNHRLYGSATTSGYGDMGALFDRAHILPNLRGYAASLSQSHTPLWMAGLVSLMAGGAMARTWASTQARLLSAAVILVVAASYLPYLVFDDWWYTRFLLPAWPPLAIAASILCLSWRGAPAVIGRIALASACVSGLWFGMNHVAFTLGAGDVRYVEAARHTRDLTPRRSIIVSMQHAGPVRYYGERWSVRWDILGDDLDATVDWFAARGIHPYFLLDAGERDEIVARLGAVSHYAADLTTRQVVFTLRSSTPTYLIDPLEKPTAVPREFRLTDGHLLGLCRRPSAPPPFDVLATAR